MDPGAGKSSKPHALPDAEACRSILSTMLLIRRFEERAGEQYAKAKVGGFLHLCIGEEATVVGATRALRETDYVLSTYREHGHALARGTPAQTVMAELFGRVDGCSNGRGGSMHLFDAERRFFGGYGIVGGNLPIAAGVALASDYTEADDVTLCMFGDGASNQGTFGETMNLAALWDLPIVFMVVNNQFGMGTSLERHSAVTDLFRKAEGFGVPGNRCDGMEVLDVQACVEKAAQRAREDRVPQLVEALTYRFRGHSMADPEEYRTKEEVAEWRRRDPVATFSARVVEEGVLDQDEVDALDSDAQKTVDEAVAFADDSPFPELDSLYDDVYVLGGEVSGWYSVDERSPEPHRGERERESGEIAHELAEQAARAGAPEEDSGREPDHRRGESAKMSVPGPADSAGDEGGG